MKRHVRYSYAIRRNILDDRTGVPPPVNKRTHQNHEPLLPAQISKGVKRGETRSISCAFGPNSIRARLFLNPPAAVLSR
jgi:hypothetical protein